MRVVFRRAWVPARAHAQRPEKGAADLFARAERLDLLSVELDELFACRLILQVHGRVHVGCKRPLAHHHLEAYVAVHVDVVRIAFSLQAARAAVDFVPRHRIERGHSRG